MKLEGKKVVIVGCARSGLGAAKLAQTLGAHVAIFDEKNLHQVKDDVRLQLTQLASQGMQLLLGKSLEVASYDIFIVSPGVPLDIPMLQEALQQDKILIGEFEFASLYCKAPIIAITGTNGKTTTTSLVGQIMAAHNPSTYIVGNIGRAFSEDVLAIPEDGIVVAEVSSFQLEINQTLHPKVSAILNISPDHLNRHKTMENYCQAKYNVFKNQVSNDFTVLNVNDPYFNEASASLSATLVPFDVQGKITSGVYYQNDALYENINGPLPQKVCDVADVKVLGVHNVENILAAIAISTSFGVPLATIANEIKHFHGVAHRIEYVTTKNNVSFYNDSKATNVDAAIRGLVSMRNPVRLIGGGMDKKTSFKEWIDCFEDRVQKLYLIGETANQIIEECKAINFTQIEKFDTLEQASEKAYLDAQEGECVLLSPACASWDMFESYEQRGDLFKSVVNQLEG